MQAALLLREVHSLMRGLGKTVLTLSTQTEPGHAFLRSAGAIPKLTTVTSRAPLQQLDWAHLRQWEEAANALGLSLGLLHRPRSARGAAVHAARVHGSFCGRAHG